MKGRVGGFLGCVVLMLINKGGEGCEVCFVVYWIVLGCLKVYVCWGGMVVWECYDGLVWWREVGGVDGGGGGLLVGWGGGIGCMLVWRFWLRV